MKSGTITLANSPMGIDEIKADVREDLLMFIIVEALRNVLWCRRDEAMVGFHEAQLLNTPEIQDTVTTSEDIFMMSLQYLTDVIAENDPLFNSEDTESVTEVMSAISDKLNLLITAIETWNYPDALLPYEEILFNFYDENVFPSVSGTFVGNKVVLCMQVPDTFGTATY
ncbi:hypothetical protein NFI00_000099 [Salmonella enterica]|nr:hypothetical protein [Salmonella enterica]